MCSAAGLGALAFGQSFVSQKAQADQQYEKEMQAFYNAQANWEINKRQADDRQKQLIANAVYQMQQLDAAQQETNDSAVEQKSQIGREMMRKRAQAELAASEAGVGGNSVNRLLADINFTEQSQLDAIEASRENQVSAPQSDKYNVRQTTKMQPIYGAIGEKPSYKGNSMINYLSAAMSGLTAYGGLTYQPSSSANRQVSQTSSQTARRY